MVDDQEEAQAFISGRVLLRSSRDELFSHILRCGVIDALPEHQKEWFDDTMQYLADRYSDLSEEDLASCAPWANGIVSPCSAGRIASRGKAPAP